jgi:hypothetical protein
MLARFVFVCCCIFSILISSVLFVSNRSVRAVLKKTILSDDNVGVERTYFTMNRRLSGSKSVFAVFKGQSFYERDSDLRDIHPKIIAVTNLTMVISVVFYHHFSQKRIII